MIFILPEFFRFFICSLRLYSEIVHLRQNHGHCNFLPLLPVVRPNHTDLVLARANGETGLMTLLAYDEPGLFIKVVRYLSFNKKTSSGDVKIVISLKAESLLCGNSSQHLQKHRWELELPSADDTKILDSSSSSWVSEFLICKEWW